MALANAAPAPHVPGPADDSLNFVRTYAPRVALTDTAAVRLGPKEQVQVRTEYLDGLGRPVQTVLHQESPRGNDLALVKSLVQKLIGELVNRPFYKRTAPDSALSPQKTCLL